MNEFSKIICPYCKEEITQSDTVHVCVECETVHHLECWNKNRGCAFLGCAEKGDTITDVQEFDNLKNDEMEEEFDYNPIEAISSGSKVSKKKRIVTILLIIILCIAVVITVSISIYNRKMEELEYTYILAYREIYLDIGDASDNLKSIANTYKIRWSDELNSYYSQYSSNREIVASIKSYLRYDLDTAESDLEQINDFYDEFQFPPLNLVNSDLLFNIDQAIKAVLDSYEDYYDFLEYPYNATRWNELFPEDGYREFINTNTTKYSAYMGSVVELGNLILKTYDLYK